jgi:autotransporter-associated beta strand protein
MALFRLRALRRWLRALPGNGAARPRRPRPYRPAVEALEDRRVPASFTWTGNDAATNAGWMDGNNWSGNVAPPADGTAALFFTATATRFNSINDFPSGTSFASLNLIETSPTNGSGTPVGYTISPKADGSPHDIVVSGVTAFDVGTNFDSVSIGLKDDGSGNTSLSKDGAGTLFLSGANTYRGGTTLRAGTLQVNDGVSLGSGQVTLNGGTFQGSGAPVTFGSANAVRIGGNIIFAGIAPITFNGPVTLAAFPGISVNNTSTTFNGQITENTANLGLIKFGPGTLALGSSNNYSGATIVVGGPLAVGNDHALGSGQLVFTSPGSYLSGEAIQAVNGPHTLTNQVQIGTTVTVAGSINLTFAGSVTLTSASTLTVTNPGTTLTVTGAVGETGGSQSLFKDGAGTLALEGVNTYTGITRLTAGTLAVGNNSALGVSNGNGQHQLVLLGGTLRAENTPITLDHQLVISGPATVGGTQNITFTGATVLINSPTITVAAPAVTVTLGGQVSDSSAGQSLFKDGPGTLVLGTANAYTGNTFLLAGTLVVGNDGALGPAGTLFLDGGTITANGSSRQLANPVTFAVDTTFGGLGGTLLFTGPITLVVSNHTATLNDAVVFQGNVGQSGGNFGLTVTGPPSGSLQLAGTNTFAGGITLNGRATLFINSDGALGSGPFTLNGGSVLNANDRSFPNNVTLAGDVTFQGAANLTFSGPLTLNTPAGLPVVRLPVRDTTLTFAGPVTGGGPLVKAGPGSLVVSGPSPAALNTVVLAGAIAGRNSGQLGSLTASGGDVSPGGFAVNGTAGPGTLTVNGNLALTGASTFTALVNGTGTQFDQIVVGGTVAVGGQLQVILNFSPAVGTAFTLIKNNGTSPVQGFFAGLPEGTVFQINGQRFRITYAGGTGRDVVLTRFEQPPPSPPPAPPPAPVFRAVFAQVVRVRSGGRRSHGFGMALNVFDAVTGSMRTQLLPFGPGFRGRLMVFTADLNGDGVGDLVVFGTQGRSVRLAAFNGKDLSDLSGFLG